MGIRTLAEITAITGFMTYFLWSAGKIWELRRRVHYRDAAFFKIVKEHAALTTHFKELTDEVTVKHKEVTETFNGLLRMVTEANAAQARNAAS